MPVFLSIDPGSLLTSLFHLLMFWKNVDYASRIGLGRFKLVAFGLAAALFDSAPVELFCQIPFEIIGPDLPFAANLLCRQLAGLYEPVCSVQRKLVYRKNTFISRG